MPDAPEKPWIALLGGIAVEEIRPKPLFAAGGHVDAATALVRAGGVPATSPDTPLVVAVNDPDRATDTAQALRALREASPGRSFRIVVATGSHEWEDEIRARHEIGLRAAAGAPTEIFWHDARSPSHVAVGPARLDSFVAQAQDIVGIGSVEPHWFAGVTGAHKTLTVGVMHRDDIADSHYRAMSPGALPFRLAGNPVHEGFAAVLVELERGRRVVALQHVATRWFGGRPLECLVEATNLAQARWLRRIPRACDFLVAVVGPPLSRTLYQAEKGIKNNEFAVRDGGMILLEASCEAGLGPSRFFEALLAAPDAAAMYDLIQEKGYRLGDHKAWRLRTLQARGVRVGLVSAHFPRPAAQAAGLALYASRDEAARVLRGEFSGASRGVLVEDAAHVVVEGP